MGIDFSMTIVTTKTYEVMPSDAKDDSSSCDPMRTSSRNGSYLSDDKNHIIFWDKVATYELGRGHLLRRALLDTNLIELDEGHMPACGQVKMTLDKFAEFLDGFYNDGSGSYHTWEWVSTTFEMLCADTTASGVDAYILVNWG